MDVENAFRTGVKFTVVSKIEAWKMCTKKHNEKIMDLESRGYQVKQMWECQWAELKQSDPVVRDFVNKLDIVAPLNTRDAFCGGCTNVIKLTIAIKPRLMREWITMTLLPCTPMSTKTNFIH